MKACFVIPLYEHGATLREVVAGLAAHRLPCLVVDDGSGPATRAAAEEVEREYPFVHVHRHERNRGKGGALQTAYRLAAGRGCSHALQLDADGQHDAADVPRFLAAMEARPEALVLGVPVFDESVPRSRLYGRQISRAMVWALTLSGAVRDPLCGFRGIPLEPTVRLLDRVHMGERMDFDPELAVRLVWEGVPVVSVPTRVVYRAGGISHFDVVWDDVALAWLYTRLFGGLAWRAPGLLARRLAGGARASA